MKIKDEALNADYEAAPSFVKLKVGKLGVYYPDGFKIRAIKYNDIDRVFIRIHEVNGKMCCGSTIFQYFRMVFVKDQKEFADYVCEDEKAMDMALEEIRKNAPQILFGVEND